MRAVFAVALAVVLASACVDDAPFVCHSSAQCLGANGETGVCGADGTCDFGPVPVEESPLCQTCGDEEICAGEACTCIAEVKAGADHTCARKADGTVWCWGENEQGALGNGATADTALPVPAGIAGAVEVAGGEYFSCARLGDGTVWCWGSGEALGGGSGDSAVPVQVAGVTDAVELGLGEYHACARRANGHVWCWGRNDDGQVGEDANAMVAHRVKHLPAAIDLAVGGHHACILDAGGGVWCWGKNDAGQLGDGSTTDRTKAVQVDAFAGAVEVASGGEHTCVRKLDDGVWCVGANAHGQLGAGGGDRAMPVAVEGLPDAPIAQLALGEWNSCVRLVSGHVHCWGRNDVGQLGLGAPGPSVGRAGAAVTALPPAIDLVLGERHACARTTDGRAWCWGAGDLGQLGDGQVDLAATPREVMLGCP